MNINNKFELEEIVFLITDNDQYQRIITGIQIYKNGILYRLACGVADSWHYEYEIERNKTFV